MPAAPFLLRSTESSISFAPNYYPDTFRGRKQRNLDRQENICGGEDISDSGSKNLGFHISGRVRGLAAIEKLLQASDTDEIFDLVSDGWTGEVRIKEAEFESTSGYHPPSGERYWKYTLDVVSTGRDEDGPDASAGELIGGPTTSTGL